LSPRIRASVSPRQGPCSVFEKLLGAEPRMERALPKRPRPWCFLGILKIQNGWQGRCSRRLCRARRGSGVDGWPEPFIPNGPRAACPRAQTGYEPFGLSDPWTRIPSGLSLSSVRSDRSRVGRFRTLQPLKNPIEQGGLIAGAALGVPGNVSRKPGILVGVLWDVSKVTVRFIR